MDAAAPARLALASGLELEFAVIGAQTPREPCIVFLHEGLGSVSMWRDFPGRLCAATGYTGLVYSRAGYGNSTPLAGPRPVDFMAREARDILPQVLAAFDLRHPLLFGHSDGGSIALLYAAAFPEQPQAVVALAPHLFVEELSVRSIADARRAYLDTDLRARLARHHRDVDGAFFGWNDIWLSDAFRSWNIAPEMATIRCPVLAVQGFDDEYGTMAQIEGIKAEVAHAELLQLEHCGHSPHRDQGDAVIQAVCRFLSR